MRKDADRYLVKLEAALDLDHQAQVRELYRHVYQFQPVHRLPSTVVDEAQVVDADWPSFPYNDTFCDPEKMLLDQLRGPFIHNQLRTDAALNIRCNYGTVILPSIFGIPYQLIENSLPWAHHVAGRREISTLVDRGVPDLRSGLGGRCFDTAALYRDRLAPYPKLRQAVAIYHPDLQGPFDAAHLIWGHDIFYALYDCPDLVHSLLTLVTETYRRWMRAWKALTGEGNEFTTHWDYYLKGGIMLRDDSAVMLSTPHYEEFVRPYDQLLLDEFGGCIHFCGRGAAFLPSLCQCRNLYALNCSQLELNDTGLLRALAERYRLVLLGWHSRYLDAGQRTGVVLSA